MLQSRLQILTAIGFVFAGAGCGPDMEQPLPIPTRIVCLDFSATAFPDDWKQAVYNNMVADFSDHGLRITFHDFDACDFLIRFGGDDATRWGVARIGERQADVFTETIQKWDALLPIDAYLQGVSNAAAHELGHLLGYSHSTDPTDVMSVPESASVRFYDDLRFYP